MGVQANMASSPPSPTTTMIAQSPSGAAPSPSGAASSPPTPTTTNSRQLQRKRKSAMKDFNSSEEYKQFARRRNEATRRCRQKKEIELKDLREEVPQIKAANQALEEENLRLKAENARLVEELNQALAKLSTGEVASASPSEKSGKKQKKKVPKASEVKENWGGLENADAAEIVSPEETDYCWYSDFLDTPIAYSPDLENCTEESGYGSSPESPRCSTIQMLDIALPTDDVLCPGPSRQN